MKLLIIEDNDPKFEVIEGFINDSCRDTEITRSGSYQSGIESLVTGSFDCCLLDMSLPDTDVGRCPVGIGFLSFGGELILRECSRRGIKTKFIVVTQYESFIRENSEVSFNELRDEVVNKYAELVIGFVKFDLSGESWRATILNIFENENINY